MKFYEDYFETPYYFSKYDQIFCPEFNAGAMENAGLVTFNDRYVFREEVDASRLTGFTNTITHEMAHHWFGNLVTMKWWNGLWLNESFADFISHYCISKLNIKTRPLSNVWLTFNLRKGWGYRTD
jgi:aminopeptidase N